MIHETPYAAALKDTAAAQMMRVVAVFSAHTGMTPTILSKILVNDTTFIPRVGDGAGFTVTQFDRIISGLSAIWPDDLAWPRDVPRQAPARLPPDRVMLAEKKIATAQARKKRKKQKEADHGRAA